MLDPRSRNALLTDRFPIDIGIVKLLGSPSFFGFSNLAPQSSSRVITPVFQTLLSYEAFKSFEYFDIISMASVKGMVTSSCLIKFISLLYHRSLSCFIGLQGYNFSRIIACLTFCVSWLFVLIDSHAISSTIMFSSCMSSFTLSFTSMSFLIGS